MPNCQSDARQRQSERTITSLRSTVVLSLAPLLLAVPGTAMAAGMEVLLRGTTSKEGQADTLVELRLLNPDDTEDSITLPDRTEARIDGSEGERTIILMRSADTPANITVAAHGFAEARYRMPPGEVREDALLSVPAWSTQAVRLTRSDTVRLADQEATGVPSPESPPAAPPTDKAAGNAFLANLAAYEPIYAVYGPGTNSDARIQISFKYKLFGSRAAGREPEGLHFAYTQRMFWDLGGRSSPFRNIDFQPEIIYITPSTRLDNGITLAAQVGIRHESNGRDGLESRSINSLYVAPMAAVSLGGGYRLSVAPRLSVYIGDKSDNPDIVRYRGHTGLFVELGKDDGLRLSTATRFNPRSGKAALNADLSYPLPRLWNGGPDFYLFAQSFVGYGENLLDYDRHATRLRIGVALVR
ncbi:Phospholipase A [Sphingopyxis granuli]|nr:Phospholipase A [Sphingopyxis granuli]